MYERLAALDGDLIYSHVGLNYAGKGDVIRCSARVLSREIEVRLPEQKIDQHIRKIFEPVNHNNQLQFFEDIISSNKVWWLEDLSGQPLVIALNDSDTRYAMYWSDSAKAEMLNADGDFNLSVSCVSVEKFLVEHVPMHIKNNHYICMNGDLFFQTEGLFRLAAYYPPALNAVDFQTLLSLALSDGDAT